MTLDPVKISDTRKWFQKANDDIRAAEALSSTDPPLLDEVSFHCQQAVEKAMKEYLFWNGEPLQKIHDLNVLGVQCSSLDTSLTELLQQTTYLTQYAVEYRYPEPFTHPTDADTEQMIALARRVLEEFLKRLPQEIFL